MKATRRKSGKNMITVVVKFHLGIDEMTYYAHVLLKQVGLRTRSRQVLVDFAKEQLAVGDYPHDGRWDDVSELEKREAYAVACKLFPELEG